MHMYVVMAVMAIYFIPMSAIRNEWAYTAIKMYCRYVRWSAQRIVGLRSEIRGRVPAGEVLICAKHQSFFDILILCSILPKPRFVMKKELARTPIVAYFARKIECVSVDRGKKGAAIVQLKQGALAKKGQPGQLIIYPQGTRVAPKARKPYKVGSGVIYTLLEMTCVPVATNVGCFWPRKAIFRSPGLAVVEFLPAIEPGLAQEVFMQKMERLVESSSDRLIDEAENCHGPIQLPTRTKLHER